jgi:hypothetical protein
MKGMEKTGWILRILMTAFDAVDGVPHPALLSW